MTSKKTSKKVKETVPSEKPAKIDPKPSDDKTNEPVTYLSFYYWHAISLCYWHLIQVTQTSDEEAIPIADVKETSSKPVRAERKPKESVSPKTSKDVKEEAEPAFMGMKLKKTETVKQNLKEEGMEKVVLRHHEVEKCPLEEEVLHR